MSAKIDIAEETNTAEDHNNDTSSNDVVTTSEQVDGDAEHSKALSSNFQAWANIVKANIGSGILGMPFAFKNSGYILGMITLVILALLTLHSTILLIKCKNTLNRRRKKQNDQNAELITYGEVGKEVFGIPGDVVISSFLIFTQCGFCCAYLIFIGENLSEMLGPYKALYVLAACIVLVPISMIRALKYLSPFSITSELCLLFGILVVVYYDIHKLVTTEFPGPYRNLKGFDWKNFPVFFGITIFSFEGIGLALPIEHNMKSRKSYNATFVAAMIFIASLMASFGVLGYIAFGQGVNSLVTLNLPHNGVLPIIVKCLLMVALLFTYPIQQFPVSELLDQNFRQLRRYIRRKRREFHAKRNRTNSDDEEPISESELVALDLKRTEPDERVENILKQKFEIKTERLKFLNSCLSLRIHSENVVRMGVILVTGILAFAIPDFGNFLSLIGGVGGTMLAFVLPSAIHLRIFWGKISVWVIIKDICIIIFGVSTVVFTAYMSVNDIIKSFQKHSS